MEQGDIQDQAMAIIKAGIEKAGSEKALAETIGLRVETIRHWVAQSQPSLHTLIKIQKFLNANEKKFNGGQK